MKRIAGILLVSVYMLSFAEFHNLLKFPVFIAHLKEHRQQDPKISIWAFIKLHYLDRIVVDDDYQRDQQLPFRDTDCCAVTATSVCELYPFTVEIQPPAEMEIQFQSYIVNNKSRLALSDIFQPPRFA